MERSLILAIILIAIIGYKYLGKLTLFVLILSLIYLVFQKHVVNLINKNQEGFDIKDLSMISFWNFAKGDNNQKIYFSGRAGGNNNAKIVENEGLVLSSAADWAETNFITKTLSGSKSLVAWATITDNDGSRGGAPIAIFQDQTQHFDAIVWAERENNKWMVGSDHFRRTNKGTTKTPDSPINTKQCIVMTQDYSGDNIIIKLYIDGEKVDEYTSPNKITYEANTWRIYFGPRHTNQERTRRSGHFIGTIHAAGLFDKALTEDEVKQLPSLLDTLTEIKIGSSSTNPKEVSLPENVTYVDNMPYNEQNPVWKDTFENTINTANKTLSVKRTDNDGKPTGWGQNLVFKGYANKENPNMTTPITDANIKPVYSNFEKFTFNNTNKELSDSNDLKLTDKFTVMAWVKQKEKTNDWVRIIGKGNKTNRNYGLWVKGKDGQLLSQVYTVNNDKSNVRVANSYLENDKWTHLAMTYNKDGRQRLYKNGKMIEAKDSKGKPLTDDEPLTIGGAEIHSKFKGEITGAVVLDIVLNEDDIKKFAESPDKNLNEILGTTPSSSSYFDTSSYCDGGKIYVNAASEGISATQNNEENCAKNCMSDENCEMYLMPNSNTCYTYKNVSNISMFCEGGGNHAYWGKVKNSVADNIIKYPQNVTQNDTQLFNSLNGKYNVSYQNMIRPGVTMEVNDGKMRQTNKDGNNIFDEKIQTENIKNKCTKEDDKDKTFYVENTYGQGKYECLKKDGNNIIGNHYFANNTLFGPVEYAPIESQESVKYGEPVNLHLTDGVTEQPIPLVKISYAGTKTPAPTELNGNDIVEITDANNENKILVMGKDRFLTMIDKTLEPKPEYDVDQFLLKPEVGQLSEKEYKEKLVTDPIKYGEKIAIAIVTKRQRNILYNGCGWFGCRVLRPNTGHFGHGGKNRDKIPYTTLSQGSTNNIMQTTESVGESVKYGQPVNLELIDGKTKQPVPSLKILNANDKTSTGDATYTKVMFADAENENKILVMGKDRFITMIDTTSQPKPEYHYDTFNILPDFNVNGNPVKPANSPIKFGDKIAVSVGRRSGFTGNCGWFGCRVLYPEKGSFGHGGKNKDKVPYTTISQGPEPTLAPAPAPSSSFIGSGILPVSQLISPDAAVPISPEQDKSGSDEFRPIQPTIIQGLEPNKVTGDPVYYKPGTVKYKGLGYSPSYSEMIYLNNHVYKSTPETINQSLVKGFCNQSDNIMNKIDEKCSLLEPDVCASTECCVLFGGQKCVEGDNNGPKNKMVYSDTTIKNRDVYYYQGDCYGNCPPNNRRTNLKQVYEDMYKEDDENK